MSTVSSLMLLAVLWNAQIGRWVVWVGLVVLTVALLALVRTRWGQSQPLGKCVVLSLVAHLLLGIYTTTVNIVTATVGSPDGQGIQVALVDSTSSSDGGTTADAGAADPWNPVAGPESEAGFGTPTDLAPIASPADLPPAATPQRKIPVEPAVPLPTTESPELSTSDDAGPPVIGAIKDPIAKSSAAAAEPIEMPQPEEDGGDLVPPPERPDPMPETHGDRSTDGDPPPGDAARQDDGAKPDRSNTAQPGDADAETQRGANLVGPQAGMGPLKPVPKALQQRMGNHLQGAKGLGATQASEAAVTAALRFLADRQDGNGHWDARRLEGGAAGAADGQERQGAGSHADNGITGLSLLAFLAAGHTHLQGPHQATVRRGLEYLLATQDADGSLAATTNIFERMYCHAMATCALSEAFAMTGDRRLEPAVRRAIEFTVRTQDRTSGSWRYLPGQSGDTSQLGWQVMALKSAELAGIAIPQETRAGIARFLASVAAGNQRGLAFYQPERAVVTRSMTAEALVCRQFLGILDRPESLGETSDFLLQELPGVSHTNLYYWYYATLAMYQLQGNSWQRWNEALQKKLLATQRADGPLAGSWDPDPVWGGCGGRAYSTALATLCLEVYYRFLPLYVEAAGRDRRAK
jgi:hypothetical protein